MARTWGRLISEADRGDRSGQVVHVDAYQQEHILGGGKFLANPLADVSACLTQEIKVGGGCTTGRTVPLLLVEASVTGKPEHLFLQLGKDRLEVGQGGRVAQRSPVCNSPSVDDV